MTDAVLLIQRTEHEAFDLPPRGLAASYDPKLLLKQLTKAHGTAVKRPDLTGEEKDQMEAQDQLGEYTILLKCSVLLLLQQILSPPATVDQNLLCLPASMPNAGRIRSTQGSVDACGGLCTLLGMLVRDMPGWTLRKTRDGIQQLVYSVLLRSLVGNPETQESFAQLRPGTPPEGFPRGLRAWSQNSMINNKVVATWHAAQQ